MFDIIQNIFDYTLVHATLRASTPILFAALGALISKQANILNIAMEGIMLISAYFAVLTSYWTGSWLLALLAAITVGFFVSLLIGGAHLKFQANIVVVCFGVNMLALAVTRFMLQEMFGVSGYLIDERIVPLPKLNFPMENPVAKSLFSGYSYIEVLAFPTVLTVWYLLFKTTWGLRLRSVGLNPMASETAGISVYRKKFQAILLSGCFAGVGGAYLSLGYTVMFGENMTNGRGFMGVAAMNFSGGNPILAYVGCLIFGFSDSVGARLQAYGIASQFILMIPYLVTIFVLAFAVISIARKENKTKSCFYQNKEVVKKA